jgi:ParB family transcriptional regulator, chromosome partitioning protein
MPDTTKAKAGRNATPFPVVSGQRAGQKPEQGYRILPIGEVNESPLNHRKHFDQQKLAELAQSIQKHGILTPLLGRPLPDGTVELAAGHRRFRAAQIAGLDLVPVVVRPMDDVSFLEVLTIENLQREDVHPIEEAEGFQQLLERGGYTFATLADKIGKTEAYVRGRVELLDLVPVVRGSFLENRITIGHARLISRLAPDKQEEALGMCFYQRGWRQDAREELLSVADLKVEIQRKLGAKDLSNAPFALDDGSLANAPACTHCPRCTGVQRSLLADDTSEQTCLDPACYSQKLNAHIARKTAAGLVAISTNYSRSHGGGIPPGVLVAEEYAQVEADQVSIGDYEQQIAETEAIIADPGEEDDVERQRQILADLRAELADELERAKGCPHAEEAVIVHGANKIGSVQRICRNPECPVHGEELRRDAATAAKAGGAKAADPWKEKRARLDDQIKIEVKRELERRVYAAAPKTPDVDSMFVVAEKLRERVGHDVLAELCKVINVLPEKTTLGNGSDVYEPWKRAIKRAKEEEASCWPLIVLFAIANPPSYGKQDGLMTLAEAYGIDAEIVKKQIAEPMIEAFNAKKAKAKAKEKAEKKKPAAPKSSKMAAAGDEEDGDAS